MSDSFLTATREIAWNVPAWFIYSMYLLFIISVGIFFKGVYTKYQFVTHKKNFRELYRGKFNWKSAFQALFFQGKVPRVKSVGLFHGAIYYGFIILVIATTLVMIQMDFKIEIFKGWVYIAISFLADMAGVFILVAILFAFYRRYIKKPDYLKATKPNQELLMYVFLILVVKTGFWLEGIRILGTDMPENEMFWSPVGYFCAFIFKTLNLEMGQWKLIHQITWMVHMILTMGFIASLGYSKFIHILMAALNSFLTPPRLGAILEPMNFENENAETFGLSKYNETTMKNRLDFLSCVECGRCTQNCPANLAGKKLDPKLIITKLRDAALKLKHAGVDDCEIWGELPLYEFNELDACTTCGACMEECPVHIEHVKLIMELKRYKVLTLAEVHSDAATTINNIKVNSNPWGIGESERFKWADGQNIPLADPNVEVDYLYYVGCAGSFDTDAQKLTKTFCKLLSKADVSFAVLGEHEKCCGDIVRRVGDEYSFYEMALSNIETFKGFKFKKIVVTCPHGLHTIGKEYKKIDKEFKFEVIHHTELLSDLIKLGKLTPNNPINEEITYHDPCYLGRHHGGYEPVREILNSIPGLKLKEMPRSKDTSLCCGMGGGNMWYELPEGEDLCKNRMKDIASVNAQRLSTACFYCWTNFNSKKSDFEQTKELPIEDVALILAKSIF